MKTLYVFAHADDFFLWSFGCAVKNMVENNGEVLNILLTKSLLIDRRNLELCNYFGINSVNVCFKDFEKVVLSYNPDNIVSHWAFDSNTEHRNIYEKVSSVVLKQRRENHKGELYSTSTYNSLGLDNKEFSPTHLIDISIYWKLKKQAILKLKSEPNKMWLDMIRKQNEFYGSRIKVEYAEALRKVNINGVFNTPDSL